MKTKLLILIAAAAVLCISCSKDENEQRNESIRAIAWNNIPQEAQELVSHDVDEAPIYEMDLWDEPAYQIIFSTTDTIYYKDIFCYVARDDWEFLGFGDITVNQTP